MHSTLGVLCHVHVCSTHKCMHEGEEIDSICGELSYRIVGKIGEDFYLAI